MSALETWHERLIRLVTAKDYRGALELLRSPASSLTPIGDREAIARIVDPEAFVSLDDHRAWAVGFTIRQKLASPGLEEIARSNYAAREPRRQTALAKADAILALGAGS